jgi:hypothetical protein
MMISEGKIVIIGVGIMVLIPAAIGLDLLRQNTETEAFKKKESLEAKRLAMSINQEPVKPIEPPKVVAEVKIEKPVTIIEEKPKELDKTSFLGAALSLLQPKKNKPGENTEENDSSTNEIVQNSDEDKRPNTHLPPRPAQPKKNNRLIDTTRQEVDAKRQESDTKRQVSDTKRQEIEATLRKIDENINSLNDEIDQTNRTIAMKEDERRSYRIEVIKRDDRRSCSNDEIKRDERRSYSNNEIKRDERSNYNVTSKPHALIQVEDDIKGLNRKKSELQKQINQLWDQKNGLQKQKNQL